MYCFHVWPHLSYSVMEIELEGLRGAIYEADSYVGNGLAWVNLNLHTMLMLA